MTNEELVIKIKAGETGLMNELWPQVENFVCAQARKFYNAYSGRCAQMSVELEDLYQEGYFAIQKAVDGYDIDKGVTFLTYAGYHIKNCFGDALKIRYKNWQNNTCRQASSIDAPLNEEGYTLANTLADNTDVESSVIDKLYTDKLGRDLNEALDEMGNANWRKAIEGTIFAGTRPAEYARQIDLSRPVVQRFLRRAFETLRENPVIQAYALY